MAVRRELAGGKPERLTERNTDVAYPTPVGSRTVFYLARDSDGSGLWLWALDVKGKASRRVSFGLEQYTSIAASRDGRKLVATIGNPMANLWSVPILNRVAEERDMKPFTMPAARALAPRFGGTSLFYLSSLGTGDGLWRYRNGQAREIWRRWRAVGDAGCFACWGSGGDRAATERETSDARPLRGWR